MLTSFGSTVFTECGHLNVMLRGVNYALYYPDNRILTQIYLPNFSGVPLSDIDDPLLCNSHVQYYCHRFHE